MEALTRNTCPIIIQSEMPSVPQEVTLKVISCVTLEGTFVCGKLMPTFREKKK